jgi:hypothetical protein
MMVMVMVVMSVDYYNHLRLRRIRQCEAEKESRTKPEFLHDLLCSATHKCAELH